MLYVVIVANSITSLTSLPFKFLFGLISDCAINLWNKKSLCIMNWYHWNGLLFLVAYALAKLTVINLVEIAKLLIIKYLTFCFNDSLSI